jgi:hypothetical protein
MAVSPKQGPPVCLRWDDALIQPHCLGIAGTLHDQRANRFGPVSRIPRLQVRADPGNLCGSSVRISRFRQQSPCGLIEVLSSLRSSGPTITCGGAAPSMHPFPPSATTSSLTGHRSGHISEVREDADNEPRDAIGRRSGHLS